MYGIPVLLILRHYALQIFLATPLDLQALRTVTLLDPVRAAVIVGAAFELLAPPLFAVLRWLLPALALAWIVLSSLGRTLVLRRADPRLSAKPATLMALQTVRLVALTASLSLWLACIRFAVSVAVSGPLNRGQDPSLVLYSAIVIVSSLVLFVLWSTVSWIFSIAPLLAMLRGLGARASLAAALHLRGLGKAPLKMKLVEINLVMGIVKIAVIVLTMVFSATPLPFEAVTTPEFLLCWWLGVSAFYVLASDFFHVVKLMSYLDLWRAYEED